MSFDEMVDSVGAALGIELQVDDDVCAFAVDEQDGHYMPVLMQHIAEKGIVLVWADLGEPPPQGLELLYKTMLEANDLYAGTGGAILALSDSSGHFRLQRYDMLAALDGDRAREIIESFVSTLEKWRAVVRDYRESLPAPSAGHADAPGDGVMMSV